MTDKSFEIYQDLNKVDGHFHLNYSRPDLLEFGKNEGFDLISINTEVPFFPALEEQKQIVLEQRKNNSLHFIATFSTQHRGEKFWQDNAIQQIQSSLSDGAVGVKIWKNIGMELKDENENYIMADHQSFDPIYEWLVDNKVPLLAHLGEPRNCWLPVKEMTVTSDKDYFSKHPEYHMYNLPEFPSYKEQLKARDNVLDKHSKLTFVGAHLASLEWSVDELAVWLDKYKNAGVDLAERVCHLQHQAKKKPKKVREFVDTYQDRIIYGTDQIDDGTMSETNIKKQIQTKWHSEFSFLADSSIQHAWNVKDSFQGLNVDKSVLGKIFGINAHKYYQRLNS